MITLELLTKLFPNTKEETCDKFMIPLINACERYEIVSTNRLAAFLAQIGHESGGLNHTVENLNYSDAGLLKTFKKYFNPTSAAQYSRKPEMIANRVYGGRMGNGTEATGDGYKYRGRGFIQITGKDNYSRFAKDNDITLDEAVEYISTDMGAAISAGWFWDSNNLNAIADKGDMKTLTKKINGGFHGLEERIALYNKAKQLLGAV
jgi:putative chitinase